MAAQRGSVPSPLVWMAVCLYGIAGCAAPDPSAEILTATPSMAVTILDPAQAQEVASGMGVLEDALVPTEDGVVAVVHDDRGTELRLARRSGRSWSLDTIARIDETVPPGSAYSSLTSVDCTRSGLDRGRYLFGLFTDPTDKQLRIQGVTARGGAIVNSTWLFAIDPAWGSASSYMIFGTRPDALYLGTLASAATECRLASPS